MANTIKILGVVKTLFPVETIGNFSKRVIWVEETDVPYPNTYQVEFAGTKMQELAPIRGGEAVEIEAEVRGKYVAKAGKEYVFNTLSGFKIQKI